MSTTTTTAVDDDKLLVGVLEELDERPLTRALEGVECGLVEDADGVLGSHRRDLRVVEHG